jgi:hypothetical protein
VFGCVVLINIPNRIAIIQEKTSSAIWRHVPSQSNPADLISRELSLQCFHTMEEGTT